MREIRVWTKQGDKWYIHQADEYGQWLPPTDRWPVAPREGMGYREYKISNVIPTASDKFIVELVPINQWTS